MNKINNENLKNIVIDACNGVDGAFEKLYKETVKFSYGVACVLLKNEEDIEDVLQNSYMYVAKSIKDLKNPESFENWLGVIVRHECGKYLSKQKKKRDIFSGVLASKETELLANEDIPYELIEKREVYNTVREIVDKLPNEKRACIVLYYFEQNTLSEISEILGIPEGTVKSRLHKGRKLLEKEFNKLKKNNETLYGISVIPLVAAFFAYQIKNIVVPAAISEGTALFSALAEGTASITAVSAISTGGIAAGSTTAGTTTVVSAAGTVTAGVTVKVAAVAVAAAVASGGTVATVSYINNKKENESVFTQTSITEEYTTASKNIFEKNSETITETSKLLVSTVTFAEKTFSELSTILTVSETDVSSETEAIYEEKTTRRKTTQKHKTTGTTVVDTTSVSLTKKQETTKETTTEEETTVKKETTTRKVTTTVKPTTTVKHELTTVASDIFVVSGGVLSEYKGEGDSVSIPSSIGDETITAIGSGAFAGNSEIVSVTLSSGIKKIGQEAFSECNGLESISLPSSITNIGIGAFCGCTNLKSVLLPSGVTSIGDDAFAECSSLSSITIPSSVVSIGDNAFGGCDNLVIKCSEGSAAHDYAIENNIEFELI